MAVFEFSCNTVSSVSNVCFILALNFLVSTDLGILRYMLSHHDQGTNTEIDVQPFPMQVINLDCDVKPPTDWKWECNTYSIHNDTVAQRSLNA